MKDNTDIYVGVDIGATNIRFLLYNVQQDKCYQGFTKRLMSYASVQKEIEMNICCALEEALALNHLTLQNVRGIGIVMAPNFDRQTGRIVRWPNHKSWEGFGLKDYLHDRLGEDREIIFEDDANGAALAEYLYNRNDISGKSCAYITVSTGVGGGFILNDHLYIGEHGWAGEIGHMVFGNNHILCGCGKKGCIQTLISGPAILEKFQKRYGNKYNVTDLKEVSVLAGNGNADAVSVFKEAGNVLAIFCANLVEMLDVSCVILGGGVLQQGGNIMVETVKAYIEHLYDNSSRSILIKKSELGDSNGVIGGLALVCESGALANFRCARGG